VGVECKKGENDKEEGYDSEKQRKEKTLGALFPSGLTKGRGLWEGPRGNKKVGGKKGLGR